MRRGVAVACAAWVAACAPEVPPPEAFGCGYGGPCDAGSPRDVAPAGDPDAEPAEDHLAADAAPVDAARDASDDASVIVDAALPLPDATVNPLCPRAGPHAVCDDFEVRPLSSRWVPNANAELTLPGQCRASAGCVRLHVPESTVSAGGRAHIASSEQAFAGLRGSPELYVRAYYRYESQMAEGFNVAALKVLNDRAFVLAQANVAPSSLMIRNGVVSVTRTATTVLPRGVWGCLELGIGLDSQTGPRQWLALWLDDRPVLSWTTTTTAPDVVAGVQISGHGLNRMHDPVEAVIDDVVVDSRRIGCVR